MKMTKKLLAAVLALSLAACTAMGTISASAEEATGEAVTATEMAMPSFVELTDPAVLDGDIAEVPENVFLVWLEQNWDYAYSLLDGSTGSEPMLDAILGKNEDGKYKVLYIDILSYDSYSDFIEDYDNSSNGVYPTDKDSLLGYPERFGDKLIYVAAPVDMLECDVSVDVNNQAVTVTYNGNEIPRSEYTVTQLHTSVLTTTTSPGSSPQSPASTA